MASNVQFLKTHFLILWLVVSVSRSFVTGGVAPKSGGSYDVDSSDEVHPNVHMTEGSKPLPLNPRMAKGHTTIMNPGQTFVSQKSIAENLADGMAQPQAGVSRELTQAGNDGQTVDIPFSGNDLNGILDQQITDRPNPLLQNQVFSTINPNNPSNVPLRQLALAPSGDQGFQGSINLTPKVIYHGKKHHNRFGKHRRQERKLQRVGEVSSPYEGVAPQAHYATPPSVISFHKRSAAVPSLNKHILGVAESRNSHYLNPYQDAIYDGEGAEALARYSRLRETENEILGTISKIKNMADDLQVTMDHNTSLFEDRLQRAAQLVDGVNIV